MLETCSQLGQDGLKQLLDPVFCQFGFRLELDHAVHDCLHLTLDLLVLLQIRLLILVVLLFYPCFDFLVQFGQLDQLTLMGRVPGSIRDKAVRAQGIAALFAKEQIRFVSVQQARVLLYGAVEHALASGHAEVSRVLWVPLSIVSLAQKSVFVDAVRRELGLSAVVTAQVVEIAHHGSRHKVEAKVMSSSYSVFIENQVSRCRSSFSLVFYFNE